MCGICGIASSERDHQVDDVALLRMRNALKHRGPDDAGSYVGEGIGLGSRRLAVLDLSERGHMPMSTTDGRFWIVYNGEIYNFAELRAPLAAQGHQFASNTDTEVLLKLFVAEGPAMLHKLNGMFAFAIWDALERRLFIARDRLGVKPLFIAVKNGALYFASEEKALFAAGIPVAFDHSVWSELLCFRFIAGEQTPFTGVRRLLPGHYLTWRDGAMDVRRWWNLSDRARELNTATIDAVQWYGETFDDAVRLRTISDVPIGVLLSGGLDSSTVAASLAQQSGGEVASFTVGFAEPQYDERPTARQLAARYQLSEHEIEISVDRLFSRLQQACWYNDEPLAHSNDPHLLAIAEHARTNVTVLLSGEGADETLGGYVRYSPLRHPALLQALKRVPRAVRTSVRLNPRWRKLGKFLELGAVQQFMLYNACNTLPGDLTGLGLADTMVPAYRARVVAEAEALYPGDYVRQAMYSDQHTFLCSVLDRNDRMTMASSIECRVPFLDYRLVEGLAGLKTRDIFCGYGIKPLLRRALGSRLPEAVLRHPKWGFGVPWKSYLRDLPDFRYLVTELPRHVLIQDSPFDRTRLTQRVAQFLAGEDEYFPWVLQLLTATQAWDAVRSKAPAGHRGADERQPLDTSGVAAQASIEVGGRESATQRR
jgi:asparagine synthase (glutamine-hydrolysing)